VQHARQTTDQGLLSEALMWQAGPLIFGPTHRDELVRWADATEAEFSSPLSAAGVALVRCHVAIMDGTYDEARRQIMVADDMFGELGWDLMRSAIGQEMAQIALAEGDPQRAIRDARASYARGGELGDSGYRSTTGAWLAVALVVDGQLDEAEAIMDEVDEMSARADIVNFAITRGARAKVAAARGDGDAAERLAHEGVEFALQTDFVAMQALAYEALASVTGDAEAQARARALLEAKGYQPGRQAYS
jgi:hypothetical protein